MAKSKDEIVGYAVCNECGFRDARVYKNKIGKLYRMCLKEDGGGHCVIWPAQSYEAQERLRKSTRFLENETKSSEVQKKEPVKKEPVKAEPVKKARWGLRLFG